MYRTTKIGPTTVYRYGPWDINVKASGVLCPDGKRRTVRLAIEADTAWSIPASVQYKGKTVAGFISSVSSTDASQGWQFIPYTYRRNGHLFEEANNG